MMRILSIVLVCLLCVVLAVPALAAETDGFTLWHYGFDSAGNLYEIWYDSSTSISWYYLNGVKQLGSGLIFINGNYYYVRTSGAVVFNRDYGITHANGLLPVKTYYFDSYGRLTDPPYYPDDWESQWFDSDPTVTIPTEPPVTDPPVTEPPVTEPKPSDPVPGLDTSADPVDVMGLLSAVIAICAGWFTVLMGSTGYYGIWLAGFFFWCLYRFLLSPVFGHASDMAIRKGLHQRASDRAKKKKEDS